MTPFARAMLSAKRFIAGVGERDPVPPAAAAPSKGAPPATAPSWSLPIMRWATSHTASIAPIISCLPITTSSRRHSSCAVNPGSTSDGSACLRTPNSDSPVSVGTMFFPWATRKACLLSPAMISARVAGVPMPLASFSRSRSTSSSTKRQAFCIASIRVPSLYRGGGRVSLSSIVGFSSFAVSPLRNAGSNCASSPFSSAGCHSGNAARQPRSMGWRPAARKGKPRTSSVAVV